MKNSWKNLSVYLMLNLLLIKISKFDLKWRVKKLKNI